MQLRFLVVPALLLLIITACSTPDNSTSSLTKGPWRGVLYIQGQQLPFNFEVSTDAQGSHDVFLINAGERLLLDDITIKGDSVFMPLHIFDATLTGKITGDSITGEFIRHYAEAGTNIPFKAVAGERHRFTKEKSIPKTNFSGTYSVQFTNEKDTTDAIGVFKQYGDSVTGTFLTASGDYRYLQGQVIREQMNLSAFDGNHVYLFRADSTAPGVLRGVYYSGLTRKMDWKATRDSSAKLPDAESLTSMKPGYDKIEFSFPDLNGKKISLSDDKYKNKVVVLQLSGSWCPNCMDESKFLAPWYEANKDRGVEIIGLAFERKDDFEYASKLVKKMVTKLDIGYDFVIAGSNQKGKVAEALPMLNSPGIFPTTIFIGKDGKVKKIHTGFSGQGTGKYFDEYVEYFNQTINELLLENTTVKPNS